RTDTVIARACVTPIMIMDGSSQAIATVSALGQAGEQIRSCIGPARAKSVLAEGRLNLLKKVSWNDGFMGIFFNDPLRRWLMERPAFATPPTLAIRLVVNTFSDIDPVFKNVSHTRFAPVPGPAVTAGSRWGRNVLLI